MPPVATASQPASRYPKWRNVRMTRRLIVCTTSPALQAQAAVQRCDAESGR